VWDWDEGVDAGEKEVRDILETLRIDQGRAVLMAKADEYAKICEPTTQWEKEPWYGTPYRVEKFDDSFITEVKNADLLSGLRRTIADLVIRRKVPMILLSFVFLDPTNSFRPI
jgi:insulysin